MQRPCSRDSISTSPSKEAASSPGLHGMLIIDKPEGISSAKAIQSLKKIPWIKKIGHTGTLDPFATGLLICGINQGTRLSQFFLHGGKTYEAELILGIETDTQDATGKIVAASPEKLDGVTEAEIRKIIKTFEGAQLQSPPIYSALKHEGVPLYTLARMGTPVQKPPRPIVVKEITILRIDLPSVFLEISCSGGTYIRTLCSDIGKKLNCGGHLKTLRRTESAGFTLSDAVSFQAIKEIGACDALKEKLIPLSSALKNMAARIIDSAAEQRIKEGKPLNGILGPVPESGPGLLKLLNADQRLIAVVSGEGGVSEYQYCCVFNH